ncbi:MAG TPA: phosphatase PAP2 family protein [Anaerolineales bacterium]|jgi:undecaprenyl-diphosphatase|nr:phosphatase PAP2 family protein [Anaerolineales bacterium]
MATSDEKDEKPKSSKLPEQKLGDTPVPPWEMPTPEEKEQAKPIRRALKDAVAKVDSPEKADEVIEKLEASAANQTIKDVEQTQLPAATPASAAREVQKAAETASDGKKTEKVLKTTAKVLASGDKHQREVVSEAVQEVLNPEQQGAPPSVANEQEREYLRGAVLKRLKPVDALDANLFLFVNHLPHTPLLNKIFYSLTVAFNGGAFWYVTLVIAALHNPRRIGEYFREIAVPLTISTALVEFPIKSYFRRRRPFITIIQAIVIGKKPGTWSFPSGHSASAFGGAWLLNRTFAPRWQLRYVLASMVAFSRIYLGDHYPGDVSSGSLLGLLLAMFFRKIFNRRRAGNR